MKKKLNLCFTVLISLLWFHASANAMTFIDYDSINTTITSTTSYAGTFDIAGGDGGVGDVAGFDPLLYDITSVFTEWKFGIPSLAYASITLPGDDAASGGQGSTITFGKQLTDAGNLAALSADGILEYVVSLLQLPNSGTSFTLKSAKIVVEATEKQSVPEPTTMLLLGLGLIGLAGIRRKIQ
ncbi:MAG: PEP-CTERM sorting domain-containing protein [Deltaproteobacteria bacterium]|nr:PEP-CTERM sorting domain-containing protein [Deltaproteobacteria bacterium]